MQEPAPEHNTKKVLIFVPKKEYTRRLQKWMRTPTGAAILYVPLPGDPVT